MRKHPFVFIPFLFYAMTCSRTIGSGAPAMHVNTSLKHIVSTHVDCHNLSMITGWFFSLLPVGEIAFRMNLVSSFYGALTVVTLYFSFFALFRSRIKAALAAATIMVTYSLWWHSTIFESYALNAFFTALELFFTIRLFQTGSMRWLIALCIASGLGMFNHVEMGFLCVSTALTGCLWIHKKKLPWIPTLSRCFAWAMLGMSPWLITFVRDWIQFGSFAKEFNHAFFGPFMGMMYAGQFQKNLLDTFLLLIVDQPHPLVFLFPFGIYHWVRTFKNNSGIAWGPIAHLTLNAAFAFTYQTWNKFSHGQPALLLIAFFSLYGALTLWSHFEKKQWTPWLVGGVGAWAILYPPYFYSQLSVWGEDTRSFWHSRYNNTHATGAYPIHRYISNPNKYTFSGYADFARALFASLPKNAMVYDDDGRSFYQLQSYYQRNLGVRPDIQFLMSNSFGFDSANWGESPQHLANLVSHAYERDLPFFTITLGHPFSRALDALPNRQKYQFVKYPLDATHWVFRLKTKSEEQSSFLSTAAPGFPVPPLVLGKTPQRIDLKEKQTHFYYQFKISMQNMRNYGNFFLNEDQVFLRAEEPGAWAEWEVQSDREQKLTLGVHFATSYDYGKVNLFWNGTLLKEAVDLYTPDVHHKWVELGTVEVKKGINSFVLKTAEKNAKSSGYIVGIDFVEFR